MLCLTRRVLSRITVLRLCHVSRVARDCMHLRASQGISGHLRASQGISGHRRASHGIAGHRRASQDIPGLAGHYKASQGITGHHRESQGITGHHRALTIQVYVCAELHPDIAAHHDSLVSSILIDGSVAEESPGES